MSTSTAPKPFCLVLMPFHERFDDTYKLGIKAACEAAGAYCERVDEQHFHERVFDRIFNQIARADIIVADLTGQNPNVLYEIGYAHALDKVSVLVTRKAEDISFDLLHHPHIIYGDSISTLRDLLERKVRHFIEYPPGRRRDAEFPVEVYVNGADVKTGRTAAATDARTSPDFTVLVKNVSPRTLPDGDVKVGLVSADPAVSFRWRRDRPQVTEYDIPAGVTLYLLPDLGPMLPGLYAKFDLILNRSADAGGVPAGPWTAALTVRVFTPQGARDFPFEFAREVAPG